MGQYDIDDKKYLKYHRSSRYRLRRYSVREKCEEKIAPGKRGILRNACVSRVLIRRTRQIAGTARLRKAALE